MLCICSVLVASRCRFLLYFTSEHECTLFAFPVIANKPKPLPYLDAILPKEQDSEFAEDDKDKSLTSQQSNIEHPEPKAETSKSDPAQAPVKQEASESNFGVSQTATTTVEAASSETTGDAVVDNPYLRAIIMPKISRGLAKKTTYTSTLKW